MPCVPCDMCHVACMSIAPDLLIFPVSYTDYKIGVEQPGKYKVRLRSPTATSRAFLKSASLF
jgi:hypothetical protein